MKDISKLFGMKNAYELIEDLAAHLSWSSGAALVYEASRAHLMWMHARLRIWESFAGGDIYRRTKALPPSVQQRLLLAPQLFSLLQSTATPDEPNYAAVNSYIEVEELLTGGAGTISNICWSALGDVCLEPADGTSFHRRYQSLRAGNAVIDTRSPHAVSQMPEEWGRIRNNSDAESTECQRRFTQALAVIEQISTTALTTVESSIRVISPVSTLDNPQLTKAGSMRSLIGRMVVTNAYSDAWVREKLIDTIVHEAIHSLIYKLELVAPFHTDYSAALTAKATSPWSGRSLPLRSFVHACFVWYGLFRFWGLDERGASSPYYAQSRKGFLPQCPLDALGEEDRDLIQPYVRSAIEMLYQTVKSEVRLQSAYSDQEAAAQPRKQGTQAASAG